MPVGEPSGKRRLEPLGRYKYLGVLVGETDACRDRDTLGDAVDDTGDGLTLRLGVAVAGSDVDGVALAATDMDGDALAATELDGERLEAKDTDGDAVALTDGGTHDSSVTLPAAPPLLYGVKAPRRKPRHATPALALANDEPPPPPHAPPPTLASMRGSDAL